KYWWPGAESNHLSYPSSFRLASIAASRRSASARCPRHLSAMAVLPLLIEQPQIRLEHEAPVARKAGDLAQQTDALQPADDLVGASGGEVQPFAHGGNGNDGVIEQAVHHTLAVGRSAAQPFGDAGTELFTHAQDGGRGLRGFAADADDTFQEERSEERRVGEGRSE